MEGAVTRTKGTLHVKRGGLIAVALVSVLAGAILPIAAVGGFSSSVEATLPFGFLTLEVVGSALLAAPMWMVIRNRPAVSVGLIAASLGTVLPVWAGWSGLPNDVRASVLAAAPWALAGAAQVALCWLKTPNLYRSLRVVYLLAISGSIVHLLAYNPLTDPGCARVCIDTTPLAGDILATRWAVTITASLTLLAGLVAVVAILKAASSAPGVIVIGSISAVVVNAGAWVIQLVGWENRQPSVLRLMLPFSAGALLGLAVLIARTRTWRTRTSVERLVARLADQEPPFTASHDSIRRVHFAVPGDGRWVDASGASAADLEEDDQPLVVSDGSGPMVRLLIAPGKSAADVLDVLTPATNLALKNAQLAAVTRTRMTEVQASRRRVVAASDEERRRIERDLHDGAQQGLVSATLQMRLARGHMDEVPAELTRAETLIGEALSNLRRITHGLFPTVLTEEGLWVALQELVRASPVPVSMVSNGDDEVALEVAMAAYAAVAAVLERSATPPPANSIHLTTNRDHALLEISIEVVGLRDLFESGDFIDNFDRVGAVGGTLSITDEDHVTIVRAVLPCGS